MAKIQHTYTKYDLNKKCLKFTSDGHG